MPTVTIEGVFDPAKIVKALLDIAEPDYDHEVTVISKKDGESA